MILADYKCNCTWVGEQEKAPCRCLRHDKYQRKIYDIGDSPNIEKGWCLPAPIAQNAR